MRGAKRRKPRGQSGTSMMTVRLQPPKPEPPPVDPQMLDCYARARRSAYLQEQAKRRKEADNFIPRNQRRMVRDEKGRLRAPDLRDVPPTWLKTE